MISAVKKFDDDLVLEVIVIDKGIGMTPEEVKHVFEPFNQVKTKENKDLNPLSNGIGLSICKQICENLGGDIYVTSVSGQGSTFRFQMKVFSTQGSQEIMPDTILLDVEAKESE